MTNRGIEHGGPQESASQILARRNVAVFSRLPEGWVSVQQESLRAMLDPVDDILGSQALMTALSNMYGQSGFGMLVPVDQERWGLEATVQFIVPNTEYIHDGAERRLPGDSVLRLVVNNSRQQ